MESIKILVVDDDPFTVEILCDVLLANGYTIETAKDGAEALEKYRLNQDISLIVSDMQMPNMSGLDLIKKLRARKMAVPIIILSGSSEIDAAIEAIQKGANDFLLKDANIEETILLSVKNVLEKKHLQEKNERLIADLAQKNEDLGKQAAALAEMNRTLEERVNEKVAEVEKLNKLTRFFSPHLAEMIISDGTIDPLKSHRREITVVFLDLRGFTTFAENFEPETVMSILHEYHANMGRIILEHEGTLERFTGDGMMIFFNDPVLVENPVERAIRMSLDMRKRFSELLVNWHEQKFDIGLGIGIAQGFATIGAIGFEGRIDYGAIGPVTNLSARLCGAAQSGQILVSKLLLGKAGIPVEAEPLGEMEFKGFAKPINIHNICRIKETEKTFR